MSSTSSWNAGSLWSEALTSRFPSVESDRAVDVLVVGAGLAGLLIGTQLARSGADVLVVDRHTVGGVATRNTTAKVTALQGTTYRELNRLHNVDTAAAYAAAQVNAVHGLRRLVETMDIDCSMTAAPAYTYATEPEAADQARSEFEAASVAGLPVTWHDVSELPFAVQGAVRLDDQFHIHPGELCEGLANHLGTGHVAENATVTAVDEEPDGCRVELEGGAVLHAAHVVLATQSPIIDPGLLANRCRPMQSYALAARIAQPVPAGMYLSCDQSVRSLRPASVDGSPVLVVGGEGHPMGAPASPERWDRLAQWTADRFDGADVSHRWATHDLVPTDHIPFIGRLSARSNRRWVATGFAKWGMSNSYVAAELLTAFIGGGTRPWASVFDPTRIAATLNRNLVEIGKTSAQHLVTDRVLRRTEPRCSHQGCVLRRDVALDTWDCPCHGSRFESDGRVIQGPATADLDR